jgi:hypothetical protein
VSHPLRIGLYGVADHDFVVFDDLGSLGGMEMVQHRLVLTESAVGLTPAHVDRALSLLGVA